MAETDPETQAAMIETSDPVPIVHEDGSIHYQNEAPTFTVTQNAGGATTAANTQHAPVLTITEFNPVGGHGLEPSLSGMLAHIRSHSPILIYNVKAETATSAQVGAALGEHLLVNSIDVSGAHGVGTALDQSHTASRLNCKIINNVVGHDDEDPYAPWWARPTVLYTIDMNYNYLADHEQMSHPRSALVQDWTKSPEGIVHLKLDGTEGLDLGGTLDATRAYGYNSLYDENGGFNLYVIGYGAIEGEAPRPIPVRSFGGQIGNTNAAGSTNRGPVGYRNAAGNRGGGAPVGNQNAGIGNQNAAGNKGNTNPTCVDCGRRHKPGNCKLERDKSQGTIFDYFMPKPHRDDDGRGPPPAGGSSGAGGGGGIMA